MPLPVNALGALKDLVGEENVLNQKEDLIPFSYDGTAALRQLPGGVIFPSSTEEVSAVIKLAAEHRLPIVTRGSGTGLSGGSVPVNDSSLVLCLVKMARILELDAANLTIHVEAGVTTEAVAAAALEAGLFYPPDPGSIKVSTIGGNVAENSGGLRGLKYGVTRNYVMGLKAVLATGEIFSTGNKCVKDVAGYSLKDLFIGSEGTLAVITEIILRLVPKPPAKKTLLATFAQMDQAAEAVAAIIAEPIVPCTLEFLDHTTIHCVEEYAGIGLPLDCEALLLIETDGHEQVTDSEALRIAEICREKNCTDVRTAKTGEEADRLASARRTAFSALARVSPTTILEDVTVPRSELPAMIRFIDETAKRHRVRIGTFGHLGDGNLHPTCLTNERDPQEMQRVERAFEDIFDETIRRGGTITGEHGVGLAKRSVLPRFAGEVQMRLLRELKRVLDPGNLLNPGKILEPSETGKVAQTNPSPGSGSYHA